MGPSHRLEVRVPWATGRCSRSQMSRRP
jgi:hypothetical protein